MRALAAILTTSAVGVLAVALLGDPFRLPRLRGRWSPPRWLTDVHQQGISTHRLVGTSLAAAAAAAVGIWAITGAVLLAVVPASAVAVLPAVFYRRQSQRADQQRVAGWPDALRALKASIASGDSLQTGLVGLAHTAPPPLRATFDRYVELSRILPQAEALEAMRVELAHPISDEIFYVLAAASRGGSQLTAGILDDLAEGVTTDLQLEEAIETARTEPRLNATAAALLPWIVLVILASRDGPIRDYYTSASSVGVLLLGAAATVVGVVWFQWLSRLGSRPRVLLTDRRDQHERAG